MNEKWVEDCKMKRKGRTWISDVFIGTDWKQYLVFCVKFSICVKSRKSKGTSYSKYVQIILYCFLKELICTSWIVQLCSNMLYGKMRWRWVEYTGRICWLKSCCFENVTCENWADVLLKISVIFAIKKTYQMIFISSYFYFTKSPMEIGNDVWLACC